MIKKHFHIILLLSTATVSEVPCYNVKRLSIALLNYTSYVNRNLVRMSTEFTIILFERKYRLEHVRYYFDVVLEHQLL